MTKAFPFAALASVFCLAAAGPQEQASVRADWPQWRGPNRDGISPEKSLLTQWPESGPPIAWQAKQLGRGYASVSVADGRVYTVGRNRKKNEQLICLSDKDGSILWATDLGQGKRPDGSPTVDGDRVYVIGKGSDLLCARTDNGIPVWKKNFERDLGGKMMSGWGWSESPLIDGDRLLCTPGAPDALIVALDKKTGDVIWKAPTPEDFGRRGRDGAGYSSIVIGHGAGVKQYIQLTGRGVVGVRASDGKVLWTYNRVANGTANIPTPLIKGDYVFCSSGYGTGAALLKLVKDGDGVKAEEVYFLRGKQIQNHHGGMILVGDHIYLGHGHNNGLPVCIDLMTGKDRWRAGEAAGKGSAAIAYADGHLYFRYENGIMALIEATPEKYVLKGTFKIATVKGKSWPHPAISGGRLYLRDNDVLHAYEIRAK